MFIFDLILNNIQPILEVAIGALVAFSVVAIKRFPKMLLRMAKSFEEEAKKTEGDSDDVAAKALVAFAEALSKAADKEFGKGPRK